MPLPHFVPAYPSPPCVLKSILYVKDILIAPSSHFQESRGILKWWPSNKWQPRGPSFPFLGSFLQDSLWEPPLP